MMAMRPFVLVHKKRPGPSAWQWVSRLLPVGEVVRKSDAELEALFDAAPHDSPPEDYNTGGGSGEAGEKGPTGDKGPPGDKGPAGDKGPDGDQGPQGEAGANGQPGANGQAGAVGDKGPAGDKGPVGDKGSVGDKGPVGDKGATGDKGPTGDAGATGASSPAFVTGDGGAVTQQTNKTTGVTLNKRCGQITMNAAALTAGSEVTFTVTNNTVASTDVVVACVQSVGTAGAYLVTVGAVANGSFAITVSNASAGSLSQALVLNFVVIKAVAA